MHASNSAYPHSDKRPTVRYGSPSPSSGTMRNKKCWQNSASTQRMHSRWTQLGGRQPAMLDWVAV